MWNKIAVAATLIGMTACMDGASVLDDNTDSTQPQYLFGLSESELLAIHPLVAERYDEASWLMFNRAPFECSRYGDLCRMVGEQAAQDITREALYAAVGGADLATIVAEMDRKAELAQLALDSLPEGGGARASTVGSLMFPCSDHRLRTETFKVDPVLGPLYGKVTCKFQTNLGINIFGLNIWGSADTADRLAGYVEILGSNPLEFKFDIEDDVHTIEASKVYPSLNQTVAGRCTAVHGDARLTVAANRS